MSTAPISDPNSMPLAELKQQAFAGDPQPTPAPDPTPVATPDPTPAPAPAADPFTVQQAADGITIQMSPEFGGEVFKGKDWSEVGPKIAKAKADANAYIKQLKATPAPTQTPQQPQTQQPTAPVEDPEEVAVRELLITQTAAALGMSKEQYIQQMRMMMESSQKMQVNATLAEFHQACPDYVDTKENNDVLSSYLQGLDHFPTARELKQAYALAVYEGKLQRANPQTTQTSVPPVMPGSVAPTLGVDNPYAMSKEDLKRAAGLA